MSQAKCQVCGTGRDYWTLASVEINCGALRNWKVQACPECVQRIEAACIVALEPPAVATLRARLGDAQVAIQHWTAIQAARATSGRVVRRRGKPLGR